MYPLSSNRYYEEDGRYAQSDDGGSINMMPGATDTMRTLRAMEDGSVEVTDSMPKKEYYMSLRKYGTSRVGGSCSGIGLGNGGRGSPQAMSMDTLRTSTLGPRSQSQSSIQNYKPSGKLVACAVGMLDGTEQDFQIDKDAFGKHLFDAVCEYLGLTEREYFGITYRNQQNVWFWLTLNKRLHKQLPRGRWQLDFQVKFYPPNIDSLKEDLTRYYLCLQVRQDLVGGQLPCSFVTYTLLGAYVVQSEAGDYDPAQHYGIEYLRAQPFAPAPMQTNEMLERIAELHKTHRGLSAEEADLNFLENARKLAMFGVDMHTAKDMNNEEVGVGVYYGGIVVYRGRLRLCRISWARLLQLGYKGKLFTFSVRSGEDKDVKKLSNFRCKDAVLAKRLYKACVDHHNFFRCRPTEAPRKPNLLPGFGTRKYRFPNQERPQPKFRRHPQDQAAAVKAMESDTYRRENVARPRFDVEHWRMTPADSTPGIGMNESGRDVASQHGAGWQGCRANKGIKCPGQYYYEGRVLEDGDCRLGWATNDSSLDLGADGTGFGFGADAMGYGPHGRSLKVHAGESQEYGTALKAGDVVGCHIDLDEGQVQWSVNGRQFGLAFTIPEQMRAEAYFPAVSLKDCRVEFNFGDQPFEYSPKGPWIPVAQSSDENQLANRNKGWRMNPYDATTGVDVAPDGKGLQAQLGKGWQGCRANKGVRGAHRYYFETSPLEGGPAALCRVGWSTEEGSLILGSDKFGFGYGADSDGFGLSGQQGKKLHKDEIDNYGEAYTKGDTIGCLIDLDAGVISYSKNGQDFGPSYKIPPELKAASFFPAAALKESTMEFNFGETDFKFPPPSDVLPIVYAASENVKATRRKGPERKIKGRSYIDPSLLETAVFRESDESDAKGLPYLTDHPLSPHATSTPLVGSTIDRSEDLLRPKVNSHHSTGSRSPSVPATSPRVSMATTPIAGVNGGKDGSSLPRKSSLTQQQQQRSSLGSPSHTSMDTFTKETEQRSTVVTNGEVVMVERGEPEIETEQFYDEQGNLVKRTRKRVKVKTTTTLSEQVATTQHKEVSKEQLVDINFEQEDEYDKALTDAILCVTGVDPDSAVLNDTVADVEISSRKVESEV